MGAREGKAKALSPQEHHHFIEYLSKTRHSEWTEQHASTSRSILATKFFCHSGLTCRGCAQHPTIAALRLMMMNLHKTRNSQGF